MTKIFSIIVIFGLLQVFFDQSLFSESGSLHNDRFKRHVKGWESRSLLSHISAVFKPANQKKKPPKINPIYINSQFNEPKLKDPFWIPSKFNTPIIHVELETEKPDWLYSSK